MRVHLINAAIFAAAAAQQLNLQQCNVSAPPASLVWRFENSSFVLVSTGQCATYDAPSTNLVMADCLPGSPLQAFEVVPGGLIRSPSLGTCWDSQYYANTSGAGLGLFTCIPNEEWDLFTLDPATGLLAYKATSGLCVSGGFAPPPIPTPQQLAWMGMEVSLMISYDIVTSLTEVPNPQHFCIQAGGDANFPVPPATRFSPSNDTFTDSWMEAAKAAEAKYTLLVASHCSGFFQWQSNVKLPDGTPYPYTVAQSNWRGGRGDVVEDYVQSSSAAGLGFGFYLTWNYNYLFNWGPSGFSKQPLQPGQINVTEAQFRAMMTAQMQEVWQRYPGAITEIWCVERVEKSAPAAPPSLPPPRFSPHPFFFFALQ
jgi:hypothetical protein